MGVLKGKFGSILASNMDSFIVENTDIATNNGKFYINLDDKKLIKEVVEVKLNGSTIENTMYTVNKLTNRIVFDSSITIESEDTTEVEVEVYELVKAGGFFHWAMSNRLDVEECTTFDSDGDKEYVAISNDSDITANSYFEVENLDTFKEKGLVVLKLYIDKNKKIGRVCYANIENRDYDAPVDGIIEESITFKSDGRVHRIEV